MASNDLVPQLVLCSPARRAKETSGLVAGELKTPPKILIVPEIYDFGDGKALIECLRRKAGAAQPSCLLAITRQLEDWPKTSSERVTKNCGNGWRRNIPRPPLPLSALIWTIGNL